MNDMSYGRIPSYSCRLDRIKRFKALNYVLKGVLIAHARKNKNINFVSNERHLSLKQIPVYHLSQWIEEMKIRILDSLNSSKRAVVCIAGASSSGKGVAAEKLIKALKLSGKRVIVLSTDSYYKGISRMIMEKLPDKTGIYNIDKEDLTPFIRDLIGNKPFADKMSEEVLTSVKGHISDKYPGIDVDLIIEKLRNGFADINFDTPDAVDLNAVAETLDRLKAGETVTIPEYSMKMSEPAGLKQINGSGYDVILVEGIYGLNRSISTKADIRSFIEADHKTLLMRRLRRDVLAGRCSFTPETALWIALEIVLPAYAMNVLPDRKFAEMILKNPFTGQETFDTQSYDVQERILVPKTEIPRLESTLGKPINEVSQQDYYFTCNDPVFDLEHILRVRLQDGVLYSLVHKGKTIKRSDGKIVRPVEEYIKSGDFGAKYQNIDQIIDSFKKAGFYLKKKVTKKRKLYILDGIEIAIDKVPGVGDILELRANNEISKDVEIDNIKNKYNIGFKKPI